MGDPHVWYRIDKGDGTITEANSVNVVRAASGAFKKPNQAIATGRFQTTWAIYCSGDRLTAEEAALLEDAKAAQ